MRVYLIVLMLVPVNLFCEETITRDTTDVRSVLIARADSLLGVLLYEEAIDIYTMVLDDEPNHAYSLRQRGYAFLSQDLYSDALADLDSAISLDSMDYVSLANRAMAKYYLKDLDGTIGDSEKAIAVEPGYAFSYFNIGLVKYSRHEFDSAFDYFTKAIELDPEYGMAYYNRGVIHYHLNRKEESCLDFSKALELGYEQARDIYSKVCE